MNIFNRWGDLVFYSNQPMLHWDGRMKSGKKVNEGYYSFIIKYRDTVGGETQTEQGGFMLIQ
jgi:gliding motility-associated-like protein